MKINEKDKNANTNVKDIQYEKKNELSFALQ